MWSVPKFRFVLCFLVIRLGYIFWAIEMIDLLCSLFTSWTPYTSFSGSSSSFCHQMWNSFKLLFLDLPHFSPVFSFQGSAYSHAFNTHLFAGDSPGFTSSPALSWILEHHIPFPPGHLFLSLVVASTSTGKGWTHHPSNVIQYLLSAYSEPGSALAPGDVLKTDLRLWPQEGSVSNFSLSGWRQCDSGWRLGGGERPEGSHSGSPCARETWFYPRARAWAEGIYGVE